MDLAGRRAALGDGDWLMIAPFRPLAEPRACCGQQVTLYAPY